MRKFVWTVILYRFVEDTHGGNLKHDPLIKVRHVPNFDHVDFGSNSSINVRFFAPKGLNGHSQVGLTNMTTKFPSEDLATKIKADFKKCPKNFLKTT